MNNFFKKIPNEKNILIFILSLFILSCIVTQIISYAPDEVEQDSKDCALLICNSNEIKKELRAFGIQYFRVYADSNCFSHRIRMIVDKDISTFNKKMINNNLVSFLLSNGKRKRAKIKVEIIADLNLLFNEQGTTECTDETKQPIQIAIRYCTKHDTYDTCSFPP